MRAICTQLAIMICGLPATAQEATFLTRQLTPASSFRQDTMTLDRSSQPGQPAAPIRHFSRVTVMGGGIPIEGGGSLLGAIAVSGAPGGEADDACARAGLDAIREDIEF